MSYFNNIEHDVRRLLATSTTDKLVHYIEEAVSESYTRGFANGYHRRGDEKLHTLLWQHLWRIAHRFSKRRLFN